MKPNYKCCGFLNILGIHTQLQKIAFITVRNLFDFTSAVQCMIYFSSVVPHGLIRTHK